MRKGRDGEKMVVVKKKKKKITAEIVATTSLPVDRLTATDCNAAARANFVLVQIQIHSPGFKQIPIPIHD